MRKYIRLKTKAGKELRKSKNTSVDKIRELTKKFKEQTLGSKILPGSNKKMKKKRLFRR